MDKPYPKLTDVDRERIRIMNEAGRRFNAEMAKRLPNAHLIAAAIDTAAEAMARHAAAAEEAAKLIEVKLTAVERGKLRRDEINHRPAGKPAGRRSDYSTGFRATKSKGTWRGLKGTKL